MIIKVKEGVVLKNGIADNTGLTEPDTKCFF